MRWGANYKLRKTTAPQRRNGSVQRSCSLSSPSLLCFSLLTWQGAHERAPGKQNCDKRPFVATLPSSKHQGRSSSTFSQCPRAGGGQKPFVSKSIQNNCWLNAGGDLVRRALSGPSPSSCSASPCIFTPNTPAKWMTPSLNLIHSQGVCSAACKHHLSAPWANNFFAFGKMCSHRACKASSKVCGECINTTRQGQSKKATLQRMARPKQKHVN